MNKDVWDDLTPQQQSVLKEAGSNMINYFGELQVKSIDDTSADMVSGKIGRKVNVIKMDPKERDKLFTAAQPYVDQWVADIKGEGFDGQKVWNQYGDLLVKYAKERDSRGYPWAR